MKVQGMMIACKGDEYLVIVHRPSAVSDSVNPPDAADFKTSKYEKIQFTRSMICRKLRPCAVKQPGLELTSSSILRSRCRRTVARIATKMVMG